jgi:hypothetical protein
MGQRIAAIAGVVAIVAIALTAMHGLKTQQPAHSFQYDLTPGASFVVGEEVSPDGCAGVSPVVGDVIPWTCAHSTNGIAHPKLFGLNIPPKSPEGIGWIRIGADAVRVGCPVFGGRSPCKVLFVASNRFVTDRCAPPDSAYAGFEFARLNYRLETECGRAAQWPSQCKWVAVPFAMCSAGTNYNIIAGRRDATP